MLKTIHLAAGMGGKEAAHNPGDSEEDRQPFQLCVCFIISLCGPQGGTIETYSGPCYIHVGGNQKQFEFIKLLFFKVNHPCGGSKQYKVSFFRRYETGAGNCFVKLVLQ